MNFLDRIFRTAKNDPAILFQNPGTAPICFEAGALHSASNLWRNLISVVPFSLVDVADDGTRTPNTTASLAQRFAAPNELQTWPDLMEQAVSALLDCGRAVLYARIDGRGGIAGLYCAAAAGRTAGMLGRWDLTFDERFLSLFPNQLQAVSAADVAVIEMNVDRNGRPRGVLEVAAAGTGLTGAALTHLVHFLRNETAPGTTLGTDQPLTATQIDQLRSGLQDKAAGANVGGTVILSNGLKYLNRGRTPAETQSRDVMSIGVREIARATGVPAALLEERDAGSTVSIAQAMEQFQQSSLNACIVKIRHALARLAAVPVESVQADLSAWSVLDDLQRVEMAGRGTTAGIYSANEARRLFGLSPVPGGDTVLVQSQMRPITQAGQE